jgi:hypothetical protein
VGTGIVLYGANLGLEAFLMTVIAVFGIGFIVFMALFGLFDWVRFRKRKKWLQVVGSDLVGYSPSTGTFSILLNDAAPEVHVWPFYTDKFGGRGSGDTPHWYEDIGVVLRFMADEKEVRIGAKRPAVYKMLGATKPEGADVPDIEIALQDLQALTSSMASPPDLNVGMEGRQEESKHQKDFPK